jgi:hypothetical protein
VASGIPIGRRRGPQRRALGGKVEHLHFAGSPHDIALCTIEGGGRPAWQLPLALQHAREGTQIAEHAVGGHNDQDAEHLAVPRLVQAPRLCVLLLQRGHERRGRTPRQRVHRLAIERRRKARGPFGWLRRRVEGNHPGE